MKTTKIRVETIYSSFATEELKSSISEELKENDPSPDLSREIIRTLGQDISKTRDKLNL